ncbi:MAG: hypothetical protein SGJ07_04160 [Rhodospirillaceae bacterium]|nr:hypothetical protein [Rhodospirillaceae bacterium]
MSAEPASCPAPSPAGDLPVARRLATPADAPLSVQRAEAPAGLVRIACFAVQADADPGILPRVLGLFAKRSLVPDRLTGHRSVREASVGERYVSGASLNDGDELAIDLQVAGLDAAETDYLARCLRQIPGVVSVLTAEKARAD